MFPAFILTLLLILFMVASWNMVDSYRKSVKIETLEDEISRLKSRLKKLRRKNNPSRKSSENDLTKSNPSSVSNSIAIVPPSKQDLEVSLTEKSDLRVRKYSKKTRLQLKSLPQS